MSDPKLDADLQAFLAFNTEQQRAGFTIANVLVAQNNLQTAMRHLGARVAEHDTRLSEHDERLDEHGAAIVTIKRRLRQDSHDDEMDTGNFDVAAVKRELAEAKQKRLDSERAKADDHTWWKRSVIMWIVGALGVIVTTLLTVLVTLAISGAGATKITLPGTILPRDMRP